MKRYKKGKWVRGIPIFEKKHSSPQNSDILEHTWRVAEEGDF
jgi:hypothetical protein